MLPKTSAYVKVIIDKLKGYVFGIKMMVYEKNIIPFGIKSVLILKKIHCEPAYKKLFETHSRI